MTATAFHRNALLKARRRVLRQLLEALIFEGVLTPVQCGEQVSCDKGLPAIYHLYGLDGEGHPVTYQFMAQRRFTFNILRLTDDPIVRFSMEKYARAASTALFIEEVLVRPGEKQRSQPVLESFHIELERTLINEISYCQLGDGTSRLSKLHGSSFAELECRSAKGHPYHPCFRARVGFSQADNRAYSPEYEPQFPLFWIAVPIEETLFHLIDSYDQDQFYELTLGAVDMERFTLQLMELGMDPNLYQWVPIHPWQWTHHLHHAVEDGSATKNIIPLGFGSAVYMPQQSIRTLSCIQLGQESAIGMPDIKLSLHITNTSTLRNLSVHSVAAAPAVSEWLRAIVDRDHYLKQDAKVIILRELAGVSWLPAEGLASAIWRESITSYLKDGEGAVPFHALLAEEADGEAFVQRWFEQYGMVPWFTEWVRCTIIPVVHLLVARGIVLESHAQNMILVHRQGWPVRVALRDFHEGVEYYPPFLADPDLLPQFGNIHPRYLEGKPGDFFEMPSLDSLREMMIDALWFMNVGYFIMHISERFSVSEQSLWTIVRLELDQYRHRHPQLEERFQALNLLTPECEIEPLAEQRLYGTRVVLARGVPNPLIIERDVKGIGEGDRNDCRE